MNKQQLKEAARRSIENLSQSLEAEFLGEDFSVDHTKKLQWQSNQNNKPPPPKSKIIQRVQIREENQRITVERAGNNSNPATTASSSSRYRANSWSATDATSSSPYHNDYLYNSAKQTLAEMIAREESDNPSGVLFSPNMESKFGRGVRFSDEFQSTEPNKNQLVNSLQQQVHYNEILENENKAYQSEIYRIKDKIQELTEENVMLYEELKTIVGASLRTSTDSLAPRQPLPVNQSQTKSEENRFSIDRDENNRDDLVVVESHHDKLLRNQSIKIHRLESQLEEEKQRNILLEEEIHQLKQFSIEKDSKGNNLFKIQELEELVNQLQRDKKESQNLFSKFKEKIHKLELHEEELCQQLMSSLETVEQAKFEEAQALLHCQKLEEQIKKLQEVHESHLSNHNNSSVNYTRIDGTTIIGGGGGGGGGGTTNVNIDIWANLVVERDRLLVRCRELSSRLEDEEKKLKFSEEHHLKCQDDLQLSLNRAILQRDKSANDYRRLKDQTTEDHDRKQMEINNLHYELTNLQNRLTTNQSTLELANEERIQLTKDNQELQRQINQLSIEKEAMHQRYQNQTDRLQIEFYQRETALVEQLANLNIGKNQSQEQLHKIIEKQNYLIGKLKNECKNSLKKLEHITQRYNEQCHHLSCELDDLAIRHDSIVVRNEELERQCVEHAKTHDQMRAHVQGLENQLQRQSEQIVNLLTKQSDLLSEQSRMKKSLEEMTSLRNKKQHFNDLEREKVG